MTFPLRIRLAIASCAVFLVVIAALEAGAYFGVRGAIHSIVDHELDTRLAGVDDHLTRHLPVLAWAELGRSMKQHPAFQPELLRVERDDGAVLMEGDSLRGVHIPTANSTAAIDTISDGSRALRILTVTRPIDGRVYRLALATDLYSSAKILSRLWLIMILSIPAVLLLSGGAGYWISGRALAPVSDLIEAARSVDSAHLSARIPVPATGDEIQRLAETMNAMLARIEAGFRQVSQFTANASHELRTPLAIIRANAEIALLDAGAQSQRATRESLERAHDALRRILTEAERDSAMIGNLLQLARADAGTDIADVRMKCVDLRTSLAVACGDMQPLAEAHGISLNLRSTSDDCVCEGLDDQLHRLWIVLLDNAVKYTPSGGSITVTVERGAVAVSDTGIGISAEHLPHIFERFYRVDKARSRAQGGAGLGLAIAQVIATAHGAAINVESVPGQGSCFCVTFPASTAIAPAPAVESVAIFR